MKRVLSLIGIGTLALLVALPANAAKIIDKNKAFTACKNEVKSEYLGANRYRLARIRSSQGMYKIQFVVSSSAGKQKVLCELDKYSGARVLTAL